MNTLIEKLELQARENPKETILFNETVTKGITYEDLEPVPISSKPSNKSS